GPIANDDVVLTDDCGLQHIFHLESFYNRHEALTILTHKNLAPKKMAVSSVGGFNYPSAIVRP
ncbi:MAG TPA: hypothetical protein VHW70_12010, partial [Edaphobacter sp.]|nr:hypothetical protein [Edaphobacter sp.]